MQVMVIALERDRGRLAVSTRKLEPAPGDMLRDPAYVFQNAEEMARLFKIRVAAAEEAAREEEATRTAAGMAAHYSGDYYYPPPSTEYGQAYSPDTSYDDANMQQQQVEYPPDQGSYGAQFQETSAEEYPQGQGQDYPQDKY
jgi:hypothetical protein